MLRKTKKARFVIEAGENAENWLKKQQSLPCTIRPIKTDRERLLFQTLYMQLSKNGSKAVDYHIMCDLWNDSVVEELSRAESHDDIISELRLKTPLLLQKFAEKYDQRLRANELLKPMFDEYVKAIKSLREEIKS